MIAKIIVGAAGSSNPSSCGIDPGIGFARRFSISARSTAYSGDEGGSSATPYLGRSSQ
jgi:hypothetical protein